MCNAFGQNCGVEGSESPGAGISNADFVFYISAMETERFGGRRGMVMKRMSHMTVIMKMTP